MITKITIGALAIELYDLFYVLGIVGAFVYLFCVSEKYDVPRWKIVLLYAVAIGMTVAWMFFLFWAESGFTNWGGNNIVRVYWWVGVFVLPLTKALKLNYKKCMDLISPCLCIAHGIGHIGCIFVGCCHGYPCNWGIFNNKLAVRCFPNQPLESLVALLIAAYIWNRERKKGYGAGVDGLSFPIMLMLFGYSRFLLEFLRDNEKLFWGISALALHALLNAVIGTVAYFVIKRRNAKLAPGAAETLSE